MSEFTHILSFQFGDNYDAVFEGSHDDCVAEAVFKYGLNKEQIQRLVDGDEVAGFVMSEVE